jgi:hypothetical protein
MEVSGQFHAPAALSPGGRTPVPIEWVMAWASEFCGRFEERTLLLCRDLNPGTIKETNYKVKDDNITTTT